jgi:hypothetical protein
MVIVVTVSAANPGKVFYKRAGSKAPRGCELGLRRAVWVGLRTGSIFARGFAGIGVVGVVVVCTGVMGLVESNLTGPFN